MLSQEKINRFEFLKSLGLKGSALLAVYGMGTGLSSCKNDEDTPTPVSTGFTLDLTASSNSALLNVGGFVIENKVVIARVSSTGYVAATQICSHEGNAGIVFRNGEFTCTVHGARFSTAGAGLNANGNRGLTIFPTVLTGTSLKVG